MAKHGQKIIHLNLICLMVMVFAVMAVAADMPVDSSKILSLQEKDILVEAVSHYKQLIHEYREDMLTLRSDREWLDVRMMRIEDQKRPVPFELVNAKDTIDSKMIQRGAEISRMTALTEKHLDDLRSLDARVTGGNDHPAPNWWQLDSWLYSLMYPGKKAVVSDGVSVVAAESSTQSVQGISAFERDLETKIKAVELDNWVALVHEPNGLALDVQLPILFGLGKSEVAKDYKPFFKKLAWLLKSYPVRIEVAGYTDSESVNKNNYSSRMTLGANRAANVVQELIETGMIPGVFKIISAGDYGDSEPGKKELSPAMKRRVDVRVFFESDNA